MISLSLLATAHPSTFQRTLVRSSTTCYCSFNLAMARSPPLRVYSPRLNFALVTLAFASPPYRKHLGLPRTITRRLIMQKARRHHPKMAPTPCRHTVSGTFHSPSGVLFAFPSRYLFTIGCQVVFSLTRWFAHIHTGFHLSRATLESRRSCLARLQGFHLLWLSFPN